MGEETNKLSNEQQQQRDIENQKHLEANSDDGGKRTLSREFLADHREFAAKFDETAADSFQGEKLDKLAKEFLGKHSYYIGSFPFTLANIKFTKSNNNNEILEEDLRILRAKDSKHKVLDGSEISDYAKVLAEVYWRASQGCYFRVTFNKCRHNQEDERREPVNLARHAIRFDPTNFHVVHWYMIALGWYLDVLVNPKERILVARVFKTSALLSLKLNPHEAVTHHLLGRYYYNVANLPWYERTIANKLLGGKMEGTYEDAERSFRRSHELKDDWLPNGLWMAKVLHAQKRPLEEIKKWIAFGLKMKCAEPSSEIERRELLELQSKLRLSN